MKVDMPRRELKWESPIQRVAWSENNRNFAGGTKNQE